MAEYFEHLFKMGTGWLGWAPAVVLATPIPQLELAIIGRRELLQSIFGGPEKKVPLGQKVRGIFGMRGTTKVKAEQP
jgi:hypothetical protein